MMKLCRLYNHNGADTLKDLDQGFLGSNPYSTMTFRFQGNHYLSGFTNLTGLLGTVFPLS